MLRMRVRVRVQWIGRNVLSVCHYTWDPGFMELEHVEELVDALRGEIELKRVKRHYFERNYQYEYAVTPEHVDVARRAALWMAVYFWRRALYKVQYDGMSEEEVRAAIEARAAGYNGGMPPGARISEEAAIERWLLGERAYIAFDSAR